MLLFDKVPLHEYFTRLFDFDVDFQADNPSFRCFFSKVHVTNASKVLLLLEFLLIIPYVLFLFPWWILAPLGPSPHDDVRASAAETQIHVADGYFRATLQFLVWIGLTFFMFFVALFDTDAYLKFYSQGHHEGFARIAVILVVKACLFSFAIVLMIGAFLFWRLSVFHATKKYFEAKCEGEIAVAESPAVDGIQKLLQPM
ncbi:unnamed protein product [Caenorhabditis auriculariae]|uniref:Uncharacterized protein n=1 Tax=Caenorhabditis auriculariae TaxID=2777116 RepID=A0A8S1GLZ6_9PELO|nr:unnamed protein product [Caenorhabditis auriculariae]